MSPSDNTSTSILPHVRNRRANACLRIVWAITKKFTGASSLYRDTLGDVGRDGALLTLAAFLVAVSRGSAVAVSVAAADCSISSMVPVSTTVGHLADGVRAEDTSLDVQRLFASGAFAVDVRGRWTPFLLRLVWYTSSRVAYIRSSRRRSVKFWGLPAMQVIIRCAKRTRETVPLQRAETGDQRVGTLGERMIRRVLLRQWDNLGVRAPLVVTGRFTPGWS